MQFFTIVALVGMAAALNLRELEAMQEDTHTNEETMPVDIDSTHDTLDHREEHTFTVDIPSGAD